jgi:hypothetical protein
MWVRFWFSNTTSSVPSLDLNDIFKWVSDEETSESPKEWAIELRPLWARYCGAEKLTFYTKRN